MASLSATASEALMAWNIAHLTKGSLSVPPPDRVEAASCFSCLGGQGGTLFPAQCQEVQSDTSEGRRGLWLRRREREKHLFLGQTHSLYRC